MPIRFIIVGYTASLLAALAGCIVVGRSRTSFPGIRWLIGADLAALFSVLMVLGKPVIPDFFSVVLANEAILLSFVLLHLAIVSILGIGRRSQALSFGLAGAFLVAFSVLVYSSNNYSARLETRTAAVMIQVLISTVVVFRCKDPELEFPARAVGWTFVTYNLTQVIRFVFTLIWPVTTDILHPTTAQTYFSLFNCILGICSLWSVLWLGLCSQRIDLQAMVHTDSLTGLLNRRAFDQAFKRELQRCHGRKKSLALLLIDIDSFKAVNDNYGHLAGDEVIRQIAGVMRDNLRPGDLVGRYGGEEYVMVLCGATAENAEFFAEKLRMEVSGLLGLPHDIEVTISVGIALYRDGDSSETLIKRSDDALYSAKRSGRNRVQVALV